MITVNPGTVNSDIIGDLLGLCNEQFANPFVQQYAGARAECMFCGEYQNNNGTANHSINCAVTKYKEIAEKHKILHLRIQNDK